MSPRPSGRGARQAAPAAAGSTVVAFPGRSVRQRRIRRWGLGAGLAVLVAAIAWLVLLSPVLAVDRIEVTGTRLVDPAAVADRLAPVRGTPLPRVGTSRVGDLVAGTPGVASVRAVAQPPTGVEVQVTELAPAARAAAGQSVDVLLADGSVLRGVPERRARPVLEDLVVPAAGEGLLEADPAVRAAAAEVVAALPRELRARVASVGADLPEQVRLTLDDGIVVVWGDASQSRRKAAVASAFLEGGRDRLADGVTELDVSVPTRPLTR